MSQNLRVALWVPTANPAISNVISVAQLSSANKVVRSSFSTGGGGGAGVDFADNAEVAAGAIGNEAISPSTLRTELIREFAMPTGNFANPIALSVSAGVASADRLVKTNAAGVLDASLVILDGGTF